MSSDLYSDIVLGFMSPETRQRIAEQSRRAEIEQFEHLMKTVKPIQWDDKKTKFQKITLIDAKSWKPVPLFPVPALCGDIPASKKAFAAREGVIECPGNKRFLYANNLLPKTRPLALAQGRMRGTVYFTDDVITPVLYEATGSASPTVWMCLTPMEVLTQRRGVLAARDRTVVGGLGLGWFLNAVCSKPGVTDVIVVEKNEHLLNWLRPAISAKYPKVKEKVKMWVVDDIYNFIKTDETNHRKTRYLLDIWESYNTYDSKYWSWYDKLPKNAMWGWGMSRTF